MNLNRLTSSGIRKEVIKKQKEEMPKDFKGRLQANNKGFDCFSCKGNKRK